jgi:eukaryotic-like serine/threonine-protein kinase
VTRSGLIFDDRYRLDKRIAAGGVGQVWQATDLLLERPVAVKVLRPEYADHPETLERFRQEAKNAGALSNPHVAQVYDYGPAGPGGSPYLVMEFVDGPSLAGLLAAGPLEPVRALDIIAQAADGLSAAHRAGLVHRDVKPGNILLSRQGLVKVTDFGIAHAAGQVPVTGPGLVMGTTQYIAPERIAGDPGSAASDVYALGIVLYECLTGVPPHDGTTADVLAAHLYLPLPPLPAGVPPELDELVGRLTVKDPAVRVSDASELSSLAAGLRDSLGGDALVPSARATSPSAVLPGPVPQAAADAVRLGASGYAAGAEHRDGADSAIDDTLVMPPVGAAAGPGFGAGTPGSDAYEPGSVSDEPGSVSDEPSSVSDEPSSVSDEWAVPSRMSLAVDIPGEPPAGGPEDRRRRRAGALAVGAAVLATVAMVVLLVSGAFSGTSDANQRTTGGSGAASSTPARVPSHTAAPAARASATATASTAPAPAVTTPQSAPSSERATASPTQSATSPAATPAGSPSSTPSAADSGSSGPPSTPSAPPSATSGPPASPSPTPSPTATVCFLGICL